MKRLNLFNSETDRRQPVRLPGSGWPGADEEAQQPKIEETMTQITEIFRQVSPEELELRQEINLLENEARKMRKQLSVDKERWNKALKRQQQQGPGPDEVELCTEWIDDKVEQQLAAIRVKEQRIIQIKAEIQKAAKVMSQQLPLF